MWSKTNVPHLASEVWQQAQIQTFAELAQEGKQSLFVGGVPDEVWDRIIQRGITLAQTNGYPVFSESAWKRILERCEQVSLDAYVSPFYRKAGRANRTDIR